MQKLILYFLPVSLGIGFLLSCSSKRSVPNVKKELEKVNSLSGYKKPSSGYTDTLSITTRSAIFFDADSIQKSRIKAVMPSKYYESDVHDCFFQSRNARKVIGQNWPDIKIFDASKIRYLLFKGKKVQTFIDLDSQNQMCGLFLFDPPKAPLFADMMNIDTELGFYFKK